jgi:hypothetical protein
MEKLYSKGRIDCRFISDLFEVIGGNAYINDMGKDWFVMSKKLKSNKSGVKRVTDYIEYHDEGRDLIVYADNFNKTQVLALKEICNEYNLAFIERHYTDE